MNLLLRNAFLAFVLAPGIGFLPVQAKDSTDARQGWLTPAQVQALVASLPDAPAPGSQIDRDDLAGVLKAQAERTPAEAAQVLAEEHFSPLLFQPVLGSDFSKKGEPEIYSLIVDAAKQAGKVDLAAKNKWQRPRPFRAHSEVHPVYEADGLSYPSGHSTAAYTLAVLLGEIFPDKKEALLQHAGEIAENRVIGGVHYPSDIAAGKNLGNAIAQAILANPDFQKRLADAKAQTPALAGK
jgi:acid phosphatase (class A)